MKTSFRHVLVCHDITDRACLYCKKTTYAITRCLLNEHGLPGWMAENAHGVKITGTQPSPVSAA